MCDWLTIAVDDEAALLPLRAIGAEVEAADFPPLPSGHTTRRRFLFTRGQCACDLFGANGRQELAEALAEAALLDGGLLAHRTSGDPPRGQRALRSQEHHDAERFVDDAENCADRWVHIALRFRPGQPLPARIDGARVLAAAPIDHGPETVALQVLLVYPHTPGVTLARCDVGWRVLASEWHADEVTARAAAGEATREGRAVPSPRWIEREQA